MTPRHPFQSFWRTALFPSSSLSISNLVRFDWQSEWEPNAQLLCCQSIPVLGEDCGTHCGQIGYSSFNRWLTVGQDGVVEHLHHNCNLTRFFFLSSFSLTHSLTQDIQGSFWCFGRSHVAYFVNHIVLLDVNDDDDCYHPGCVKVQWNVRAFSEQCPPVAPPSKVV